MNNVTLTSDRLIASGLISEDNCVAIQQLSVELTDTWEKRQVFRTETEMYVSVLNDAKHPTSASKYWQAVREQANMLDNLAVVGFDYRRNEVALQRHVKKLAEVTDRLDLEEIQIDIDECNYKKASMQQNANDRMRELKLWSRLKKELDDGSFDTKDVNVHQLESVLQTLQNRKGALTQGSSQSEVTNVIGPLATATRLVKEKKAGLQLASSRGKNLPE